MGPTEAITAEEIGVGVVTDAQEEIGDSAGLEEVRGRDGADGGPEGRPGSCQEVECETAEGNRAQSDPGAVGESEATAGQITLNGFKNHLNLTESPRTTATYLADAIEFESFRSGRPLSIDTLEAWVGSLHPGRKPQTIGRKLAAVRRWLAYRGRHGDAEAMSTLAILTGGYQISRGARQADRKRIEPVTVEAYRDARARAPDWARALMSLLWWCGPRISEVIGDRISGIPFLTVADGARLIRDGYTETIGKGGKRRTLVLPTVARAELSMWLDGQDQQCPLFPSPHNPDRPISAQAVNRTLHCAGLRQGADAFRHGYKMRLRRAGVSDEIMRALMGHGPRNVTDQYGRVGLDEMMRAAEMLAPASLVLPVDKDEYPIRLPNHTTSPGVLKDGAHDDLAHKSAPEKYQMPDAPNVLAAGQPQLVEAVTQPTLSDPGYPRSFAEWVGQQDLVRLLRVEVKAARRQGRLLAHMVFFGPPGVGKTGIVHVLAGEVGAIVYESSGAEFPSQKDTVEAVRRCRRLFEETGRPIIWLIDEIDGMTRVASYAIFSLMTHGHLTIQGRRWGGVPITIMATTNRMASVPGALRSRFQESVFVSFYDPLDLAEIARRSAAKMGFSLTGEAAQWIGENAAGEPRKVNRRILRNVANLIEPGEEAGIDIVREALELSGLMQCGLSKPQFDYLMFLRGLPQMTAGLASIAACLGQDAKDIQHNEEVYLIRTGFVAVTRTGRQLTQKGRDYLAEVEQQDSNSSAAAEDHLSSLPGTQFS